MADPAPLTVAALAANPSTSGIPPSPPFPGRFRQTRAGPFNSGQFNTQRGTTYKSDVTKRCFYCGIYGHLQNQCFRKQNAAQWRHPKRHFAGKIHHEQNYFSDNDNQNYFSDCCTLISIVQPDPDYFITCRAQAIDFPAVLVTGSSGSLIKNSLLQILKIKINPPQDGQPTFILSASQTKLPVLGIATLQIDIAGPQFTQDFIVVEDLSVPCILGRDCMLSSHCILSFSRHTVTLSDGIVTVTVLWDSCGTKNLASSANIVEIDPQSESLVPIFLKNDATLPPLAPPLSLLHPPFLQLLHIKHLHNSIIIIHPLTLIIRSSFRIIFLHATVSHIT